MGVDPARIEEIFGEALGKADAAARAVYVDQACGGDAALRERVEELLAAHAATGNFLKLPHDDPANSPSGLLGEGPGAKIGRYKLLEQIGEGGFGVVFMAEQTEPVQRKVALKIIKPGMDTRQVIARFEAERQALALMDHPHIAKVLDAGSTDTGRPYFVMELVKGLPIVQYCDEHHLAPRERLELFVSVCQAVQHAHQKGIIHRDLKPSNVLVAEHDERTEAMVIDFGVAKAIGRQLTEKTMFTQFGQMVGTIDYMSPEQAKLNQLDVDTRTDIYSLGVLLYELLTGSTPLDRKRLQSAAFDEMLRIIREVEPPTPSTRLSGSDEAASIAANRGSEPKKLAGLVRGELDWIVMKALAKDRNRRYETVSGLARDVERYLHDDPVEARPPSAGYRFRKFAHRNKAALLTFGLVAAALVAGTVVSTWQAIRATNAESLAEMRLSAEAEARHLADKALAAEAEQRTAAEKERAEAEKQRGAAEANYQKARAAVDKYFTLVSESTLFEVPGLESLRQNLLEAALDFYEGAALERFDDPVVMVDAAMTHLRVGLVYFSQNRGDDYLNSVRRALDMIDRLRKDHADFPEYEQRLAGFWKGLRWTQSAMDQPRNAQSALRTMLRFESTWTQFARKYPSNVDFQRDLASVQATIGTGLSYSGRPREGAAYYRKGLAITNRLVTEHPTVAQFRDDLAVLNRALSGNLWRDNQRDEAQALLLESLRLDEALVNEFPNVPAYRAELAGVCMGVGARMAKEKPQDAEQLFRRAREIADALIDEFPTHRLFVQIWANAVGSSSVFDGPMDDYSQVEEAVKKVLDRFEARIKARPRDRLVREALVAFCNLRATHLRPQGNFATLAARLRQRSLELTESLALEFPDDRNLVEQAAGAHGSAAGQLWGGGQTDEAAGHYQTAVAMLEKLARRSPQPADTQSLGDMVIYLARIMSYGANTAANRETCRVCLRACEMLDVGLKSDPLRQAFLAVAVRAYVVRLMNELEHPPEAERLLEWSAPIVEQTIKEIDMIDKVAANRSTDVNIRHHAADTHKSLAMILTTVGRTDEAEDMWLRAIRSFELIAKDHPSRRAMVQYVLQDYGRHVDLLIEQHATNGQPDEAAKLLRQFVATVSKGTSTRSPLAGLFFGKGDSRSEVDQTRKSLSLAASRRLVALLAEQQKFEEAHAAIRDAVEANEGDLSTNNSFAWFLVTCGPLELRNPRLAIELAQRAVDRAPNEAMYRNTLGVAQYRAGKWEESIGSLTKAEALAPDKSLAFSGFFLAMAHWQLDHQEEARTWYDRSVDWMEKNQPKDADLIRFRGEAAQLLGIPEAEPTSPDVPPGDPAKPSGN